MNNIVYSLIQHIFFPDIFLLRMEIKCKKNSFYWSLHCNMCEKGMEGKKKNVIPENNKQLIRGMMLISDSR